ncbi:Probable RNA-directed DNA polymerase from transposon X-element [Eumeta japonica]|uniref:Probable RNA-directed DNA polymerase from transposon X-element n=1 Tax=Eumeta variegata TaxID=151549 RepID=A0A4C2A7Z3_EUMVA|nr:Probable RNA-directed DNA polymerase from transposon X-element [Eumeta japonica]
MLQTLCLDNNSIKEMAYHMLVRITAGLVSSGKNAMPVSGRELGKIVESLPNTALGLNGISWRTIKHAWKRYNQRNGKPVTDPKAYRPITLLLVLKKVLESVAAAQLQGSIGEHQQFCFRKVEYHRAKQHLGVARGSDAKYVQLIFLDISGAFDNAWWPMLMTKVKRGEFPSTDF